MQGLYIGMKGYQTGFRAYHLNHGGSNGKERGK